MEIVLAPVSRLGKNSRVAIRLAQPLFDWVDGRQNPTEALAREVSLYLTSSKLKPCPEHLLALSRLIRGHAMDLWEDDGFDALSWHQGLITGVQLLLMSQEVDDRPANLNLSGVCSTDSSFSMNAHGFPSNRNRSTSEPEQWRMLRMEDVAREIDAVPHEHVLGWFVGLSRHIKKTSIPFMALTSGAWLGLSIGGRLTGLEGFMIQAPDWDSEVYLSWNDAASGGGPTGDFVPL